MTIEPAAGIACEQFEKVDSASDGVGDCRRVAAFTASGRIEQAFEGVRDGSDTSKFNGLADIRGSPGAKSNGGIHAPEIVPPWGSLRLRRNRAHTAGSARHGKKSRHLEPKSGGRSARTRRGISTPRRAALEAGAGSRLAMRACKPDHAKYSRLHGYLGDAEKKLRSPSVDPANRDWHLTCSSWRHSDTGILLVGYGDHESLHGSVGVRLHTSDCATAVLGRRLCPTRQTGSRMRPDRWLHPCATVHVATVAPDKRGVNVRPMPRSASLPHFGDDRDAACACETRTGGSRGCIAG